MMRVFVCSPLRGPDGQPSEANRELARRLMRAVFDAGHAPFVPHLLYPQVLTESEGDLKAAFAANFAFLDICDETWVYADDLAGCSRGMRAEVEWVEQHNADAERRALKLEDENYHEESQRALESVIAIHFMPEPFKRVREALAADFSQKAGHLGTCGKCGSINNLNSQGICLPCFSGATT